MRGGSSRGPFFKATDLPHDPVHRDAVLLRIMGSPDARQIDGLGGAHPLTSKIGIVSPSKQLGEDFDFLFGQVSITESSIDYGQNCGNMLAAVLPFALLTGLCEADPVQTIRRVRTVNTNTLAEITVDTPGGIWQEEGQTHIDGVPGRSAAIRVRFLQTEGSSCGGKLFPTGNLADDVQGIRATCIDNGMPMVILAAQHLGVTGHEDCAQLEANASLRTKIESIRLEAGLRMGLGDVTQRVIPKVCIASAARLGGTLCTRMFIPHQCHSSIGVLGAVTVATAAVTQGTVAHTLATNSQGTGEYEQVRIEHPSGSFELVLQFDSAASRKPVGAELIRTARLIMSGQVHVPTELLGLGDTP
jgi:4-oxalomesaconate tautomerase